MLIDSGTSGKWEFEKYNDGTFVAYGIITSVVSIAIAVGDLFGSPDITISLSDLGISAVNYVSVDTIESGYSVWSAIRRVTASELVIDLLSPLSRTA